MKFCSSSTIATGTKADLALPHRPMRTPRSPADEKVSAERGTRVAGIGASGIATSAVMPSGIAPSAFGDLDLDPIGARGLRSRTWRRSGSCPCAVSPVTSRTSAVSPTLTPASLRSATSTTASIGSSATICAISLPGERERRAADLAGTSVTMPAHGAMMTPRSRSASAAASAASAALSCASRLTSFELRHGAVLDQPALGVELGLALLEQRLGLQHLRLARLVGEDGDDVALLHAAAAAHPQLGEQPRCAP